MIENLEPKSKQTQKSRNTQTYYIESYGCAMNFNDSEIVASILNSSGFSQSEDLRQADLILINTCSIREKAEQTIRNRLKNLVGKRGKKADALVGILGCMAERLKSQLLDQEKLVDIVVGPDAYRSLPGLITEAQKGRPAIDVLLSREETYEDIAPVRLDQKGLSAFISIMRGCNNMCSFCVVPFTRGRERSRPVASILQECQEVYDQGYKEVTLLGQNVDSYLYQDGQEQVDFAKLLRSVAAIAPDLRVRFSTSHPKDITDDVLYAMAECENICNYIHLPLQSGSTRILQLMNRTYTREWYLRKIDRIRELVPECVISSDIIAGFCSETEEDHRATLSAIAYSRFDLSYMYFYSERPGTLAARRMEDDVLLEVKKRRLQEIIDLQRGISAEEHKKFEGRSYKILLEGPTKKDENMWCGRSSQNHLIVFPKEDKELKIGQYAMVHVSSSNSATLFGEWDKEGT